MCSYSFTVFMSAFQLLPVAPFHILALGGTGSEAGLFLGFLTYASAVSAPITGAMGDRLGKRRVLIVATRPFIGRYADRVGHARVIVPCLAMMVVGIGVLALLSIPYFLYMEKRQWTTSALAPPA